MTFREKAHETLTKYGWSQKGDLYYKIISPGIYNETEFCIRQFMASFWRSPITDESEERFYSLLMFMGNDLRCTVENSEKMLEAIQKEYDRDKEFDDKSQKDLVAWRKTSEGKKFYKDMKKNGGSLYAPEFVMTIMKKD